MIRSILVNSAVCSDYLHGNQ